MYWNDTPPSERYNPKVWNDGYPRYSSSDVFASSYKSDPNSLVHEEYNQSFSPSTNSTTGLKWRSKRVEEFKRQENLNQHKPKRSELWWYKDPTGACQGPFNSFKMQEWYMQGFFKSHLPIRCDKNTPFIPLGQWFETNNPAFLDEVPLNWREKTQHIEKSVVAHAMEEKLEDKPSTDEGDEGYEKYSSSQVSEQHQSGSPVPCVESSPLNLYTPMSAIQPTPLLPEVPKRKDPGMSTDWWINPTSASFSNVSWQQSTAADEPTQLQGKIMSSPKLVEKQASSFVDTLPVSRLNHKAPTSQQQAFIPRLNPDVVEFRSELKSLGYDRVLKEHPRLIETAPDPALLIPTPQTQIGPDKKVVGTQHQHQPQSQTVSRNNTFSFPVDHQPSSKPIPQKQTLGSNQEGRWRQAQSISWSQRIKPKRLTPNSRLSTKVEQRTAYSAKTKKPPAASSRGGMSSYGGKIQNTRQGQKPKPKTSKTEVGKKKSRKTPVTNLENPFGDDWQKMSSEFRSWCKEELNKLVKPKNNNKFTDFTDLIKFLMSLSSEEEARDMIIQYLGNTPKVQTFADGFLLRKCFTMDEWAQQGNTVQNATSRSRRKKKWRQE